MTKFNLILHRDSLEVVKACRTCSSQDYERALNLWHFLIQAWTSWRHVVDWPAMSNWPAQPIRLPQSTCTTTVGMDFQTPQQVWTTAAWSMSDTHGSSYWTAFLKRLDHWNQSVVITLGLAVNDCWAACQNTSNNFWHFTSLTIPSSTGKKSCLTLRLEPCRLNFLVVLFWCEVKSAAYSWSCSSRVWRIACSLAHSFSSSPVIANGALGNEDLPNVSECFHPRWSVGGQWTGLHFPLTKSSSSTIEGIIPRTTRSLFGKDRSLPFSPGWHQDMAHSAHARTWGQVCPNRVGKCSIGKL